MWNKTNPQATCALDLTSVIMVVGRKEQSGETVWHTGAGLVSQIIGWISQ